MNTMKKLGLSVIAGIGVAIILFLVVYFGDYLGTAVIRANSPRTAVFQGEPISLSFANIKGAKINKIEVCSKLGLKNVCNNMKYVAKGSLMTFTLPVDYPIGKADIKFSNRNEKNRLTFLGTKNILVKKIVENSGGGESSGGSNGGGNSGSNGSGNSGNASSSGNSFPVSKIPTPTPSRLPQIPLFTPIPSTASAPTLPSGSLPPNIAANGGYILPNGVVIGVNGSDCQKIWSF